MSLVLTHARDGVLPHEATLQLSQGILKSVATNCRILCQVTSTHIWGYYIHKASGNILNTKVRAADARQNIV